MMLCLLQYDNGNIANCIISVIKIYARQRKKAYFKEIMPNILKIVEKSDIIIMLHK